MTKKIFSSTVAVVIAVFVLSFAVLTGMLYAHFSDISKTQLHDELSFAAHGVELNGAEYLETLKTGNYRITLIAADGTVLYDTDADADDMENHVDREEIREALESGIGESERHSSTLTVKMMYLAQRLNDGTVLRISVGTDSVFSLLLNVLPPMAGIAVLAILLSALLARHMANAVVKPLNTLDLENPTENEAYEELAPLLTKINKQQKQIAEQVGQLRQKKDEFEQITVSMKEGLVLLDKNGAILSMNPAAQKLFETNEDSLGRDFLTVDRSEEMSHAIRRAFGGNKCELRSERNGREYQFLFDRMESDDKTVGVVILCLDITETAFAERKRREFSANVSHELKTPLQSIIGSAELLENGLVKAEDMPRFIGNIRKEAERLVTLINDIIRLSQLDEEHDPPTEPIDLHEVAKEVVDALRLSAEKKQVTFRIRGGSCVVKGVRRYLYEILYNLCDNAVRYNKAGGEVCISLSDNSGQAVLSVRDTGIGIPPEHRDRIFERFYRVDKSHSKETGGTGLGLSIVKHAVQQHGASIRLESTVGEGTTVTVTF